MGYNGMRIGSLVKVANPYHKRFGATGSIVSIHYKKGGGIEVIVKIRKKIFTTSHKFKARELKLIKS